MGLDDLSPISKPLSPAPREPGQATQRLQSALHPRTDEFTHNGHARSWRVRASFAARAAPSAAAASAARDLVPLFKLHLAAHLVYAPCRPLPTLGKDMPGARAVFRAALPCLAHLEGAVAAAPPAWRARSTLKSGTDFFENEVQGLPRTAPCWSSSRADWWWEDDPRQSRATRKEFFSEMCAAL